MGGVGWGGGGVLVEVLFGFYMGDLEGEKLMEVLRPFLYDLFILPLHEMVL